MRSGDRSPSLSADAPGGKACNLSEQIGDLAERRAPDPFLDLGDAAAAEILVERTGTLVVGERLNHDPAHLPVMEVVAHRLEEPAAETDALVFGREIELVDLAIRR